MSDYEDYDSDATRSSDDEDDDIVFKATKPVVKPKIHSDIKPTEDEEEEIIEEEDDDDSDISDFDEDDNEDTIFQDKPKKKKEIESDNESDYEEVVDNLLGNITDDDEDDDENETSEFYLQKFGQKLKETVISDWHPEMKQHNVEEINAMCTVVRDENGNIIDPLHRTLPFLTKYEKARILGERTVQLNSGAMPLVDVASEVIDGYLIAMEELAQKKIPFIIKRPLPNGGCEYWKLKDLEILA